MPAEIDKQGAEKPAASPFEDNRIASCYRALSDRCAELRPRAPHARNRSPDLTSSTPSMDLIPSTINDVSIKGSLTELQKGGFPVLAFLPCIPFLPWFKIFDPFSGDSRRLSFSRREPAARIPILFVRYLTLGVRRSPWQNQTTRLLTRLVKK